MPLQIEALEGGALRVTVPTARGWAAVARTPHELAKAVTEAFTESAVASYAAWRGERYDLDVATLAVAGDPLAPPVRRRPRRATRNGDGWGAGMRRPDVHPAQRWTELPDGRWLSPGGRTYRADAVQVQRVRAALTRETAPPAAGG